MSNMSYCRFQNTLTDLRDCSDALNDLEEQDGLKARRDFQAERIGVLEAKEEVTELEEVELESLIEIFNEESDEVLSEEEERAMKWLVQLCKEIADQYAEEES